VSAGAALVRELPTWDWDGLTFRALAERAEVSERTVYRHFPTERKLHDAVMERLEDEAGITYEDVDLANIADVTARMLAAMHRFAAEETGYPPVGPAVSGADDRRRAALQRAVSAEARDLTDVQQRIAAGLLDAIVAPRHLRKTRPGMATRRRNRARCGRVGDREAGVRHPKRRARRRGSVGHEAAQAPSVVSPLTSA
jgi:AcrR family transcriptional regulator